EIFSFFEPGTLNPQTAAKVTNYVEGPQTSPVKGKMDPVHEIIEAGGRDLDKELIGQAVNATPEIGTKSVLRPMTTAERRFIDGLPADGKREYFRQVLKAMNSDSQVVDYLGKYGKEYEEFVPKLRMDLAGSTEDVFTRFGETASEYVLRGGNNEVWGKDPMFMPRLIADYVDDADRRLINSKDFPAMASALKSVNWVNSTFKIGVYPFFPASAARDLYSNVWFNSFRIGWHAFDPRLWVQSLKVLAHAQGSPKIVRG
ncbi:MAG: hypothetical protein GY722_23450, partial [bacterium]|nr:hypothetical protein [bacterium]